MNNDKKHFFSSLIAIFCIYRNNYSWRDSFIPTMNPKKKWEKQWSRGNDRTHISNQQRQFRPESIPVTRTSSVSSLSSSPSPPDTGSPTPQESPQQVNSPSTFETRFVNRHNLLNMCITIILSFWCIRGVILFISF